MATVNESRSYRRTRLGSGGDGFSLLSLHPDTNPPLAKQWKCVCVLCVCVCVYMCVCAWEVISVKICSVAALKRRSITLRLWHSLLVNNRSAGYMNSIVLSLIGVYSIINFRGMYWWTCTGTLKSKISIWHCLVCHST